MSANKHNIAAFADRMVTLADAYKADLAGIVEEAKEVEVDAGALKRLASWKRKDSIKRDEAEALDHQYRFLAGEVPDAAELPAGGELATAVRLYGEGMTVTQVQAEMGVSRGKAHKLKTQAAAFAGVHVHANMNADPETGELPRDMVEGDLGEVERGAPNALRGDDALAEVTTAPALSPPPAVWHFITAPVLAQAAAEEAARLEKEAERERKRAERLALAERNRLIDEDPLELPAFLRRVAA